MDTNKSGPEDKGRETEVLQEGKIGCELGELVYTSAPKVLKSQSGHLGIVAETPAFPQEAERQLSRFWSYSLPEELKIPENEAVPRFVLYPIGGVKPSISLTRVQSAGFDHTGRTHPIAHHFVAGLAELEASELGISDLVSWAAKPSETSNESAFLSRWNGEPAYVEKRRLRRIVGSPSPFSLIKEVSDSCGISRATLDEAMLAAVDALRRFSVDQRMVVVVVKPSHAASILTFVAAILRALPRRKQLDVTAISHVWELNDAPAGYSLAFTYPRSPYLERIKQRIDSKKPVVIDLALKEPVFQLASSDYVTLVRSDRNRWNTELDLPIPALIDQVDPDCEHETAAYTFKRAITDWKMNISHESLVALCTSRRIAISDGLRTEALNKLVRKAGLTTVTHIVAISDWNQLFAVYGDSKLPNELRLDAWNAIKQHITAIIETKPDLVAESTLAPNGVRLTKLLTMRDVSNIDLIISRLNDSASRLPDKQVRSGAANWTVLGTRVICPAWNYISAALAAGQPPSRFYRQILDWLIPLAVVRSDNLDSDLSDTESQTNNETSLENVLAPAWQIVSRQIQAGKQPHELCKQIVEELVENAVVVSSLDSLVQIATKERDNFSNEARQQLSSAATHVGADLPVEEK